MNILKHEVTADFIVSAISDFIDFRKEHNTAWCSDANMSLVDQLIDYVESCGVGNAGSPSEIVDNYLINGDFVNRSDDDNFIDADEWQEYCQDNALFSNAEYACLRF